MLEETRQVTGLTCRIFAVTEFEEGKFTEATNDCYAQDKAGNVWYFGEAVNNYNDKEQYVDNDGSWEAGLIRGKTKFVHAGNPIPGLWYQQEYGPDEAGNVGRVLEIGVTITVAGVTYSSYPDYNGVEPARARHPRA